MGDVKNRQQILDKLGIIALNQMQEDALLAIQNNENTVLLSPTGTGKTLAFLLPIIESLDASSDQIQVLILVPSRELAIQIEQVARDIGSGFKINAIYGGRAGSKDKMDLKQPPAILIGTPGRIADHLRRETFSVDAVKTLVLDEFDKSLEVGFANEMSEITAELSGLKKRVLTSATNRAEVPEFLNIEEKKELNFLKESESKLTLKVAESIYKDKLDELEKLIKHVGEGSGIIFCNLKDTIMEVSQFLREKDISHACFFGGLEQRDREHSLIQFRNGTYRLLLATDLAARGIDVPEMDFIIHYELPFKEKEFIHRNGRTARMHAEGVAYIMKWKHEKLPEFIGDVEKIELTGEEEISYPNWDTLYISGGRRDKISKGDIAGFFIKQGGLKSDELGMIELKQDCAYVAVASEKADLVLDKLNNTRLKTKKVRLSFL